MCGDWNATPLAAAASDAQFASAGATNSACVKQEANITLVKKRHQIPCKLIQKGGHLKLASTCTCCASAEPAEPEVFKES